MLFLVNQNTMLEVYTYLVVNDLILSRPINRYTFVFYEEDSNTILTTALKNYLNRLISIEYENSKHTHQGRVQPDLQVLNNAISTGMKEKMIKPRIKFHLVPPGNHLANKVELAIWTSKKHFIVRTFRINP